MTPRKKRATEVEETDDFEPKFPDETEETEEEVASENEAGEVEVEVELEPEPEPLGKASSADLTGFVQGALGEEYRAALPVTNDFPKRQRGKHGDPMPPYLVAMPSRENKVTVMLCDASGLRANTKGVFDNDTNAEIQDADWICVGRDNVPAEWLVPIEDALIEVSHHWPLRDLDFEPDRR